MPRKNIIVVNKVISGEKYISPEIAEKLIHTLSQPLNKPLHEALSDREQQVGSWREIIKEDQMKYQNSLFPKIEGAYP